MEEAMENEHGNSGLTGTHRISIILTSDWQGMRR